MVIKHSMEDSESENPLSRSQVASRLIRKSQPSVVPEDILMIPYSNGNVDIVPISSVILTSYDKQSNTIRICLQDSLEIQISGEDVSVKNLLVIMKRLKFNDRVINMFMTAYHEAHPVVQLPWIIRPEDPTKTWNT